MRARFDEPARQEFLAQIAYYAAENPRVALRFRLAVEAAVARATAFPHAGSPTRSGARRVFVRHFPFSVVYHIEADLIVIFAIAHHARDDRYWESRLET
jgi:plasmid stabilization system protein ParE